MERRKKMGAKKLTDSKFYGYQGYTKKENNMDINKRYKHGELSADVAKVKNEKLAIDPNSKVTKGSTAGDSNDKPGAKSKVDPSIFRMAEERDY